MQVLKNLLREKIELDGSGENGGLGLLSHGSFRAREGQSSGLDYQTDEWYPVSPVRERG